MYPKSVAAHHNVDEIKPCDGSLEQVDLFVPLRDVALDKDRFPAAGVITMSDSFTSIRFFYGKQQDRTYTPS